MLDRLFERADGDKNRAEDAFRNSKKKKDLYTFDKSVWKELRTLNENIEKVIKELKYIGSK